MRKTKSICILLLLLIPVFCWSQKPVKAAYQPGVVVFKLKSANQSTYHNRLAGTETEASVVARLKAKAGANNVMQPFAGPKNAKNKNEVQKQGSSSLDGIFKMDLPEQGISVEEAVALLEMDPEVLYAEPYYLPQLLENPDDSFYSQQMEYLNHIRAPQAWNVQKGSRDIIIGILDTGVDTTHLDLRDNLYKNENDPIDGIDNDGDGYIDNYWGWDFANRDNNPKADYSGHGTQVTGVCSATTNNGLGVAGTGYNTRYMPVKVFSSKNGAFMNGYEAIVYAANMGCHVINLSWGAPSAPSKYVQDIISYVVHEKDVVIIAAAGNTAEELDFYPASYENVLSVSASNDQGQLAEWCTWSRFVDILAPGVVYTTGNNNRYYAAGGTSYSSPMVAGAAALVRAQFPDLNASQVMELMRQSANGVPENEFRSGNGLLNMETALQGVSSPSVRMSNLRYSNGMGSYAFHSDTVSLWMDFTNYLHAASDVSIRLIAENAYATVLEETIQLGSLTTLQTKRNQTPLSFKLSASLPALEMLSFRLEFSTPEGYKDYQYFNFRTSGEYIDFKVDDLTLTIASNGNLGYNYDYNLQGLGLRYQNAALAHNMGLAIAQNPTAVANNVVNTMLPTRRDLDFRTIERLRLYNHSLATMDARSSFEVIVRDSSQLNLRIDQKILGWSNPGDAAAVVLEYKIINRADTAYENLHVALFSDFNLMDAYQNRAQWDASHQLGYTYNENTGRYAGIALLSDQTQLHHALNLKTREGNTADVGNIMSRRHKWEFMNKGVTHAAAGVNGKGNDVAKFLGGTIPSLSPLTTEKVVFALVTAPSLEALQAATVEAQQNYINYANANPNLLAVITICPGISQTLTPKSGSRYRFYSTKNDVTPVAEGETIDLPPFYRDTTIYVLNIDKEWGGALERIEIDIEELSASFTPSTEDLLLNAGLDETIYFTDASQNAVSWSWNFGNGHSSTSRNPEVVYTETGTYLVELQVSNLAGCTLTTSHTIRVHRKEELPVMATASTICPNSTITLQEVHQRLINVYADENRSTLLFSGDSYISESLPATTDFYISSGVGIVESDVVKVTVPVFESQLEIVYSQVLAEQYTYALKLDATIEASATASLVNWYQNGSHIGSGQSITLGYQARNEAPDITMLVLFENGCEIAYNKKLPLSAAALPELQNLEVCKGEAPLIKPVADGLYYFYADAALTELLYRGTFYQMPTMDASQTLFITNLSGGLESEALSLNIYIAEALAAFSLTADTLTIKNGVANLTLNSTSLDATRWTWNFGDGSTSTEQNPTHGYTQAGTYTISLQAESALGCTEIFSKEVVILPTQEKILGYPNPTSGPLTLQLPTNLPAGGELLVMDAAGHKLIQQPLGTGTKLQLDLQDLPKGIYLIRIMHGQQSWHSRVVRQ